MQLNTKTLLLIGALLAGASFGVYKFAFSCCSTTASTSGCTPSNCRGAKTKFGEAKVISDLRIDLIDLKADIENHDSPAFEARTFDIHNIIGGTDEESLAIIVKEVKIIEEDFAQKLNHTAGTFDLPENKAKQVEFLTARINGLKTLL